MKPASIRRRWGVFVVMGVLAVVGGVGAAWVMGRGESNANANAHADADAEADADADADAKADAEADADADADASGPADAPVEAAVKPVVKKPKAPQTSCDPPYYYEGAIKRFKPECVQ